MSDEHSTLSIRIPKAMHDQLKEEAKSNGINLTQLVTPILEARNDQPTGGADNDLLSLLSSSRSSARFGDENILQEILRRVVSMQLISVHDLSSKMPAEDAQDFFLEVDDKVRDIVAERSLNGD